MQLYRVMGEDDSWEPGIMKLFLDERAFISPPYTLQTGRCVRRVSRIRAQRASERTNNRQRLSSPSNRASVRSYAFVFHAPAAMHRPFSRARQSLAEIATVVRVGSAQHYFRVGSQWTTFLPIPTPVRVRPVLSRARGPSSPVSPVTCSLRVSLPFSLPFVPENHYLTIDRMYRSE